MQVEQSIFAGAGSSQALAISSTSAKASIRDASVVIYATVDCFMRAGSNPTALATGVDQFIPAGVMLRVALQPGYQLAFVTSSASGTVYISPGA